MDRQKYMNYTDQEETQHFAMFNVLVSYCGKVLSHDLINEIRDKLIVEMREGPCSWAFKGDPNGPH